MAYSRIPVMPALTIKAAPIVAPSIKTIAISPPPSIKTIAIQPSPSAYVAAAVVKNAGPTAIQQAKLVAPTTVKAAATPIQQAAKVASSAALVSSQLTGGASYAPKPIPTNSAPTPSGPSSPLDSLPPAYQDSPFLPAEGLGGKTADTSPAAIPADWFDSPSVETSTGQSREEKAISPTQAKMTLATKSVWRRILDFLGFKSKPTTTFQGEALSQQKEAEAVVRRVRNGDQNAMALMALIRDNAQAGNPRAALSLYYMRNYINANPVGE